VLVLEKADEPWAGGNSAFTAGAVRMTHGGVGGGGRLMPGLYAAGAV